MAPIKKQSFNNVHPVKNYLVSLSISGINELSFVGGGGGREIWVKEKRSEEGMMTS